MKHRDPETIEEWQYVVDLCHTLLHLDAARQYELVAGGPELDFERCEELLRTANEQHGITPSDDAIERVMPLILSGQIDL